MKHYYFLSDKEQYGPFTLEELTGKNLKLETLIWTEGMTDWKALKEIPELNLIYSKQVVPPPVPNDILNPEENSSSSLSKKTVKRNPDSSVKFLILWCGFHLFALIMAYARIPVFNRYRSSTDDFWPFVEFTESISSSFDISELGTTKFNGVFRDYDITEFALYVGIAFLIYLLKRMSTKRTN